MDSIQNHYTRLIQTEIREMERFKAQAEKRNNKENVERYEKKISQLRNELSLDSKRFSEFSQQQQEILRHQHQTNLQNRPSDEQKIRSEKFYDLENKERKKERSLQYQMKKQWEWLCAQDQNLPDYIRTNLDRMPNNKGYIWKGIWYFGHKPEEDRDTLIMFEKRNGGGEMLVHEIKRNAYYKIFSRGKNGQNVLLSEKTLRDR